MPSDLQDLIAVVRSNLGNVKWRDFVRNAVAASKVAEYCYCPAKITNMKLLGEIKTPIMIEGSELHEQQAQELLSQMRLKKVKAPKTVLDALVFDYAQVAHATAHHSSIANGEKSVMYISILPELGCIGLPDLIDCSTGSPVVVEKKFVGRIPSQVWSDNELQLAIYMLSVEKLGFKSVHGVLEYHQRAGDSVKRVEIRLDKRLRKKVRDTVKAVRGLIEKNEEPIPTTNPNQCRSCRYVDKCRWRALGV
jgi:CRISPR/Cas system-associated exonuclease Cas4 (RecB family)